MIQAKLSPGHYARCRKTDTAEKFLEISRQKREKRFLATTWQGGAVVVSHDDVRGASF